MKFCGKENSCIRFIGNSCTSLIANDLDITTCFTPLEQILQRRDSLNQQLIELKQLANKLGMYDAADWIDSKLTL